MAKVTAPLLSFGASGQIAQTQVYSKWKGRPYVRRYVIPSNPNTAGQVATRSVFSWANGVWKNAPTLFISPWDRFATGQVLTGRNAMIGQNVRNLRGDVVLDDMVFSPGAKGGPPADSIVLTPAAGQITVDFTNPTPPTGWVLASAIAAAIVDQDPATAVLFTMVAAEDAPAAASVVLTGLDAATLYQVGAWLRWTKPDSSIAYGPSINDTATTP